jgi:hypothetical protein
MLLALTIAVAGCRSADETPGPDKTSRAAAEPTACEETCRDDPAPAASVAVADEEAFPGCQQGCGTHLPFTEEQVAHQPGAKKGDFARCPVSRVVFVVDGASPARGHDGKDVYFCCQPCADRFSQAPEKYKGRLAL